MKKVASKKKTAPARAAYQVPQKEAEAMFKKSGATDCVIIIRKGDKTGTDIGIMKKGFNDPRSQHELMHALESLVTRLEQEHILTDHVIPALQKVVAGMNPKAPVSKSVSRRVAVQKAAPKKVAKKPVSRKK